MIFHFLRGHRLCRCPDPLPKPDSGPFLLVDNYTLMSLRPVSLKNSSSDSTLVTVNTVE